MKLQKHIQTIRRRGILALTAGCIFLLTGCKTDDYLIDLGEDRLPLTGTWLIDEAQIAWGCSGQDCIPSLTDPPMAADGSSALSYLDAADLVLGLVAEGQAYAFPHPILDWHEVINMDSFSISYCPLTGSGLAVSNDLDYGVSGLLYASNLIMYDESTNSFWPQMLLKSAAGSQRNTELSLIPVMETNWETWINLYPETMAVSSSTGYARDYQHYPYGSYRTDGAIYFPIQNLDNRLERKDRVLGIVSGDQSRAYRLAYFTEISVLHTQLGGDEYVIFGSRDHNFALAYRTDKQFAVTENDISNGDLLFTDLETGSGWNIFGEAVSGELSGEQLDYAVSHIAYWFAWAAFHPTSEIWNGDFQ